MNKLQLAMDVLDVKRRELAGIFEAGGDDLDLSEDQVKDIQARNAELADLGANVEQLKSLEGIKGANTSALEESGRVLRTIPHDAPSTDPGVPTKSIGEQFVTSRAYLDARASGSKNFSVNIDHNVKTLISESGTGFAPQAIRTGVVVPSAQQLPRIVDVVPATTTDQVAVVYMQENVFTNAAAETLEGDTYQEAALDYEQVSDPVEKIAVFIPVTDEQLADVPGMQDRINNRLTLMIRQRLDRQLVVGNGTSPNLRGFFNRVGIQTQARGTDPSFDCIFKAITLVQSVAFADPNAILMHPTDWQNIRLTRTSDGIYIFGYPSESATPMLWGLPVVTSTYVTSGKALVADFAAYTELSYKAGLTMEVSNSHADFFANGKLAIRAEVRAALVTYRPAAIAQCTGL